jgi:hypothetical protein
MLLKVDPKDDPETAEEGAHRRLHVATVMGGQPRAVGQKVGVDPTLVPLQDLHLHP